MTTPRPPKGWHSRGYLPHFDTPERAQHVVFRVAGPLPPTFSDCADRQERAHRLDAWLDRGEGGSPLASPEHAKTVTQSLQAFAGERYDLHAWCVMPNHVHVLITLRAGFRLGDVIKSWKSFTGRKINRANGGSGAFWALDYFDRFMRDETDLGNTIAYIENNLVAAGLVASPADWPWSFAAKL
jgi:REP-associated tyrosine transposase